MEMYWRTGCSCMTRDKPHLWAGWPQADPGPSPPEGPAAALPEIQCSSAVPTTASFLRSQNKLSFILPSKVSYNVGISTLSSQVYSLFHALKPKLRHLKPTLVQKAKLYSCYRQEI